MSFRPLKSVSTVSHGARFGFAIRSKGSGRTPCVAFSICADLVKQLKWQAGIRLRLDIDDETRRGQMVVVGGDDPDGRKLEVLQPSGRGQWCFPFSGEALQYFEAYEGMYPLDGVQVNTTSEKKVTGTLSFDLPPAPEPAKEDEEEESTS
ncbi:hypothetical protein [Prosthecobacter sp.]|uniref:hypothetical protein n=1 Tax=Prosthecobacter sp. TaxID=1965333 RepID=UPI003784C642